MENIKFSATNLLALLIASLSNKPFSVTINFNEQEVVDDYNFNGDYYNDYYDEEELTNSGFSICEDGDFHSVKKDYFEAWYTLFAIISNRDNNVIQTDTILQLMTDIEGRL